jgi:monoamine oxidase
MTFSPPLPRNKTRTIQKFSMGALNRVMLRFPTSFWPNSTYSLGFLPEMSPVFANVDEDDEDLEAWLTAPLFSIAVNAAYEDRPVGTGAVLTFMVGGDSLAAIHARQDRVVAHLMRHLRAAFGPSIPHPTDVYVSNWASDPLARGSYAFTPVGTSLQEDVAALAAPVAGTLFFAGEATLSGPARGTTHGAFLSGIREAARMINRTTVVERVWEADQASASASVQGGVGRNAADVSIDDWFITPGAPFVVQS